MTCALTISAALFSWQWIAETSNATVSLRGLQAVSGQVVWASGEHGTYLVTTDGGVHWRARTVPGAEALDFRSVVAFDARNAYLASSGKGVMSKVYRTKDAGEHWSLAFTDPDTNGFFDALAFWDRKRGILLGDPVGGHFAIFTTKDGGDTWQRQSSPPALQAEGAFAASGTCLVVNGSANAWFGTGGPGGARVFRSTDGGRTWMVSQTPIRNDSASAGVFSLVFRNGLKGEAVGGDYTKPRGRAQITAMTSDGGQTWQAPRSEAGGYRSAVVFLSGSQDTLLAVGTSGSDVSRDGGQTWSSFSLENFNAVSVGRDGSVWAAGPHGAIAKLSSR